MQGRWRFQWCSQRGWWWEDQLDSSIITKFLHILININRNTISALKLSDLKNIGPLLALFPLQLDHILDVVLPKSGGTIVNMRAGLSKLRRVLNASIDLLTSQLQDPNALVSLEEQASGDRDLACSRQVDEAIVGVQRRCGQSLREWRRWSLVEDLVPEGEGRGGCHCL